MQERQDGSRGGDQVTHTSVETKEGRIGFSGGENLHRTEEFAGRPNITEEGDKNAIPAGGENGGQDG